jgi:type IV pilus assembly protein PilE
VTIAKRCMSRRSTGNQGFTLIELVIAIAIVGILTAIAVSSYGSSVVKSRRSTAKACVLEGAQYMERYYTTNLTYAGAAMPACSSDPAPFYTMSFSGTPDATTYIVQAVPKAPQSTSDAKCGTLSVDQTGLKGKSGTGTIADCW